MLAYIHTYIYMLAYIHTSIHTHAHTITWNTSKMTRPSMVISLDSRTPVWALENVVFFTRHLYVYILVQRHIGKDFVLHTPPGCKRGACVCMWGQEHGRQRGTQTQRCTQTQSMQTASRIHFSQSKKMIEQQLFLEVTKQKMSVLTAGHGFFQGVQRHRLLRPSPCPQGMVRRSPLCCILSSLFLYVCMCTYVYAHIYT